MITTADLKQPGATFLLSMGLLQIIKFINDGYGPGQHEVVSKLGIGGSDAHDEAEDIVNFINCHHVSGFHIVDEITGAYFSDYHYNHFTDNKDIAKVFSSRVSAYEFIENVIDPSEDFGSIEAETEEIYVNPNLDHDDTE